MPPKKSKPKRAEIFIGGEGQVPVMFFSRGDPVGHGAEAEIELLVETPTHRFRLRRMLYYADYQLRSRAGRFPAFSVNAIVGTAFDKTSGKCMWDLKFPPSVNEMAAVKWQDGSWDARAVEVENLSLDQRLEHQRTLNREGGKSYCLDAVMEKFIKDYRGELDVLMAGLKTEMTPPGELPYWQALKKAFDRQEQRLTQKAKWLAVSRMVITGVMVAMKDPRNTKTDYTSPTIFKHLCVAVKSEEKPLGPSISEPSELEKDWAEKLRIYAYRGAKKSQSVARRGKP